MLVLVNVNIMFSKKLYFKNLHQLTGYTGTSARKLIKECPSKWWCAWSLNRLLKGDTVFLALLPVDCAMETAYLLSWEMPWIWIWLTHMMPTVYSMYVEVTMMIRDSSSLRQAAIDQWEAQLHACVQAGHHLRLCAFWDLPMQLAIQSC